MLRNLPHQIFFGHWLGDIIGYAGLYRFDLIVFVAGSGDDDEGLVVIYAFFFDEFKHVNA